MLGEIPNLTVPETHLVVILREKKRGVQGWRAGQKKLLQCLERNWWIFHCETNLVILGANLVCLELVKKALRSPVGGLLDHPSLEISASLKMQHSPAGICSEDLWCSVHRWKDVAATRNTRLSHPCAPTFGCSPHLVAEDGHGHFYCTFLELAPDIWGRPGQEPPLSFYRTRV